MKFAARHSTLLRLGAPFAVAVIALAAWQALVTINRIPPYLVPSPLLVAHTLYADRVLLFHSLSVTLGIALTALALATLLGVATALLFVQSRWIEMSLFPYAILLQVTPIVSIAPLIIIWVHDTREALVLCAVVVAIFPIISNTTLGLRSVDRGLLDLFRLARATRWQTLWRLRVPSALPYFFGGLRIASGLAYQILLAGIQLNIPRLFGALVLIAAAGVALFVATAGLSRIALSRWHESEMQV
jgi:NitT/TauT family transport system permease protein